MNAKTIKTESGTKELYKAILMLKNIEEMSCFFGDLLTESELVEFGLRWKVAQMLIKKFKYTVIEKETGLSSTTIARVQKWLNNGMGGYRLVIDRMHHHN